MLYNGIQRIFLNKKKYQWQRNIGKKFSSKFFDPEILTSVVKIKL